MAQDYPDEYLGLPGDNFNLYAVMNLFQQSETIEGFERSLNDENTRINNLDLNNDNLIDYVKAIDYVDGNVHTIVLQAQLDRNDNQDVAVFTVQKLRDGAVQIQLIGDEALYGRNYIVEPIYAETPNPGYTGRSNRQNVMWSEPLMLKCIMAACKVHLPSRLQDMALFMVLGLLPFLLEPMASLLLALLLRISLQLVPYILQPLPPLPHAKV